MQVKIEAIVNNMSKFVKLRQHADDQRWNGYLVHIKLWVWSQDKNLSGLAQTILRGKCINFKIYEHSLKIKSGVFTKC